MNLPPNVRKAAVDALYEARNQGLVMDDAAVAVVNAVLPFVCEDIAKQITDVAGRYSSREEFDYRSGLQDAAGEVRHYLAAILKRPGPWHDSASSATGPDSTAGTP